MKVVFLYSRIVSYVEGMLKGIERIEKTTQISVIHWDHNKKLPHKLDPNTNIKYYSRSSFDNNSIFDFLVKEEPELIYISGWMDSGYITATKKYKKINKVVKVVAGIDDQWNNTIRQNLGSIYYKLFYKSLFEYIWVAGSPQYHYARKLGYEDSAIIYNLYSADTSIFNKITSFSKRFVFLGRFSIEKGILQLIEEYESLDNKIKEEWPLILIGHGPLLNEIESLKTKYIKVLPFMQSEVLLEELNKGGIFCLPSTKEMWGVVIHELALIGYPLLLSNKCGAASKFLINGFNGFSFDTNKKGDMKRRFEQIVKLSPEEINNFAIRSHELGKSITVDITVASLMSIIK